MYHMHSVAILDGACNLCNDWCGVVLTEALVWLLLEQTTQITSVGMLQDHKDVRCIPEESKELQYMRVPQVGLYFYLVGDMPLDFEPFHPSLLHGL